MASFDTLQQLIRHPEWIAPRTDLRVFLGEPGAPEATKTTVEPGNAFSPGMRTFGVTWWLRFPDRDVFFAPERAPLDALVWHYEAGYLPLIHCDVQLEGLNVRHSVFQDGHARNQSEAVCGRLVLTNQVQETIRVQAFLVLRSLGPAGGPLTDLAIGDGGRSLWDTRRAVSLLGVDQEPSAVGCGVGDPSGFAVIGDVPAKGETHDPAGWCFGLMRFDVMLTNGMSWQLHFDCPLQTNGSLQENLPSRVVLRPNDFAPRAAAHLAEWRTRLSFIQLDVPDVTFRNAFFAGLQHMLTAMVGDQARIAPLSYPLPWLRDSVYIIRCFDLAGLHDIARAATDYCARNDFFGGFGAEGDAPGQGIWALVQHYCVTRDRDWLASVYSAIQRKCDWLFRMRRAQEPLQITIDTPILPFMHAARAAGVICLAAEDGLIRGTMDHGVEHALGWVNHWALCGFREAAFAARELGRYDDEALYDVEAAELHAALLSVSESSATFWEHERTVNSFLWPTRGWEAAADHVKPRFDAWWAKHRSAGDTYQPEPYWLYFEFAQAHNALLLGERERAWSVLDYRLRHQDLPGLYGWREGGNGVGTENAVDGVTLINQLRGCQRLDSITPHGWSQAELWLLQRAMLIEEWQDGLLLFAGVPQHWLGPNARIALHRFPTRYGCISTALQVDKDGQWVTIRAEGIDAGTPIQICLSTGAIERLSDGEPIALDVHLSARCGG